jgi:hypothetical protein
VLLAAPVASYGPESNVVATFATAVTITGLSFGASDWTLTLTIGKMVCSGQQWASSTLIRCLPGRSSVLSQVGAGYSLQLAVTIARVIGTSALTFTFDGTDAWRSPASH